MAWKEGRCAAQVVLAIAGIMSEDALEHVNRDMEKAEKDAFRQGVNPEIDPFMPLSFLALPVIPTLRLTTRGLFDINTRQCI